ncbi:MAG: hypothetical protein ACM3OC_04240 [Deltaproteobacteria bacterium]
MKETLRNFLIGLLVVGAVFFIVRSFESPANQPSTRRPFFSPRRPVTEQRNKPVSEWDIAVRFDAAEQNPVYIFRREPAVVGQTYYARLGTYIDNIYEEYYGRECCPTASEWGDFYQKEGARRAKGWYVERRGDKVVIRGFSRPDCLFGPGYVKGAVWVNPDSGLKIVKVDRCSAQYSNKGQETYCRYSDNKLEFAAGNDCKGCCACSDSGRVDIELQVGR